MILIVQFRNIIPCYACLYSATFLHKNRSNNMFQEPSGCVSQETLCVHYFSLSPTGMIKHAKCKHDHELKSSLLCVTANHLHYSLESLVEKTSRFIRIHLQTWEISRLTTRSCGKCFRNANFLGLHRFDWRVFTIITVFHDNGLISKRPKFLARRGVYKLVDCLQLLPNSRATPRSHLCGN